MDDTADTAQVIIRPPLGWGFAVIVGHVGGALLTSGASGYGGPFRDKLASAWTAVAWDGIAALFAAAPFLWLRYSYEEPAMGRPSMPQAGLFYHGPLPCRTVLSGDNLIG